jgi:hypothetical protein
MSTTLKISPKMAALLTEHFPEGGTVALIAAEVAAGRADKAGAVQIAPDASNVPFLYSYALGRIGKLDADLAAMAADSPDKRPLMGEHSAWRALVRQLPAPPLTVAE